MIRDITVPMIKKDYPFHMAKCAFENNLTDTKGQKWAKKHKKHSKHFGKMMVRVNAIKAQANHKKNIFKFGIQVPQQIHHEY